MIGAAYHQAKIAIPCQRPLVALVAPKIYRVFIFLNPNLQSYLLCGLSRYKNFKVNHPHFFPA